MGDRADYFKEVMQSFQRHRGKSLVFSSADWKLTATWYAAGIPIEAVRRGIEAAFHESKGYREIRHSKSINGLAWCSEAVLSAARSLKEASVGTSCSAISTSDSHFASERVAYHLRSAATALESASIATVACATTARQLRELASQVSVSKDGIVDVETLEHSLVLLEDQLLKAIIAAAPEDLITSMNLGAARYLKPYRSRMTAANLKQLERQWIRKSLLPLYKLPRFSLFYLVQ